jgi:hypothetical protein
MSFDFNYTDRILDWEPCVQQLLRSLSAYEGWLHYFRNGDDECLGDSRFDADIAECRQFREKIESWYGKVTKRDDGRLHLLGFRVHDGEARAAPNEKRTR